MFGRGPAANRWPPTGGSPTGLAFPRERKGDIGSLRRFAKREENAVTADRSPVLQHEALSRRKTGIKPLPALAFYTVLTIDKTSELK